MSQDAYGEDFDGVDDIDASWRVATGDRALLVGLARRLSTKKGALACWGWPTYGDDIRDLVGTSHPPALIESRVEAECEQDERVYSCTATATKVRVDDSERLDIDIRIRTRTGEFERTLRVSELSVEILDTET